MKSSTDKNAERRGSNRVKRTLPAWYRHTESTFVRSIAFSVGEGGASLVTDRAFGPNDDLKLALKLSGEMVTVCGKAVWHRPADDYSGRYLVGVKFEHRDSPAMRRLSRWHHTEYLKERAAV